MLVNLIVIKRELHAVRKTVNVQRDSADNYALITGEIVHAVSMRHKIVRNKTKLCVIWFTVSRDS
jgi:hypothetical protein